ncbi:hypothetical protein ZIOFF_055490 [Zingiber officinale]|uniref:Uncharacterized protein n=1 Tax=Zingiber officinale TaxID=94328 RepID=A0A8J5FF50_ZINOF|nr:hypothetical protein ZIOFF_055490 [Zingiber officinale]
MPESSLQVFFSSRADNSTPIASRITLEPLPLTASFLLDCCRRSCRKPPPTHALAPAEFSPSRSKPSHAHRRRRHAVHAEAASPSAASVEEEETGEQVLENSPVEQVALTVPVEDDPSAPALTFRMWVLGTASCVLLSFLNQFFWYRKEPLSITAISAQIAVVPLGHLMAATITDRVFFRESRWEFTLNPGPFNIKEHVLITIFANSGAGSVKAIYVVTAVKIFYRKDFNFFVSLVVVITTQASYFC